jgi:HAD superfamily phosphatase (TIGR01668 family)
MKKLLTPDAYVRSIFDITPEGLKQNGIYGLILDIDNTLVATHTKDADDKVISFIKKMNANGIKAIIVSNARKERVEVFSKPLGIEFVFKALKPLGKGFDIAVQKMNLPSSKVAIIGDQLFTDVLGGNLKGIHSILLKPIDLDEPFLIKFKRIFEKPFLSGKQYKDKY